MILAIKKKAISKVLQSKSFFHQPVERNVLPEFYAANDVEYFPKYWRWPSVLLQKRICQTGDCRVISVAFLKLVGNEGYRGLLVTSR